MNITMEKLRPRREGRHGLRIFLSLILAAAPAALLTTAAAVQAGPTGSVAEQRQRLGLGALLQKIPRRRDSKPVKVNGSVVSFGLEAEISGPQAGQLVSQYYGLRGPLAELGEEREVSVALLTAAANRPKDYLVPAARGKVANKSQDEKVELIGKLKWDDLTPLGRKDALNILNKLYSKELPSLHKLSSAPPAWADVLHGEGCGTLEIVTKPLTTLHELNTEMDRFQEMFPNCRIGMHVHVVHKSTLPPGKAPVDYSRMVELANAAIYLRSFAGGENLIAHHVIGIPNPSVIAQLRDELRLGKSPSVSDKFNAIGLRSGLLYDSDDLYGLEIRGLGSDPGRLFDTARLLTYGLATAGRVNWDGTGKHLDFSSERLDKAVEAALAKGVTAQDGNVTKKLTTADVPKLGTFIRDWAIAANPPSHENGHFDHRAFVPWANWSEQTFLPPAVRARAEAASLNSAGKLATFAYKMKQRIATEIIAPTGMSNEEGQRYANAKQTELKDETYRFVYNLNFDWHRQAKIAEPVWTSLYSGTASAE